MFEKACDGFAYPHATQSIFTEQIDKRHQNSLHSNLVNYHMITVHRPRPAGQGCPVPFLQHSVPQGHRSEGKALLWYSSRGVELVGTFCGAWCGEFVVYILFQK